MATKKKKSKSVKTAIVKKPAAKASKASKTSKPAIKSKANKSADWENIFQPLEDRILVQVEPLETVTAGGIIIPTTAENKSQRARVLATGQGKRSKKGFKHPLDVQVGDLVLFGEYAGTKIQIQNTDVLIINESDVLGVVE